MKLIHPERLEFPTADKLNEVAKRLLTYPQADAPVIHRFGPGVYIRQITIPAGAFAIGRHHRHPHMNVMLTGRVTVMKPDGSLEELKAPMTFLGQPGQKVGYIHETMTWLNVFATEETDIEKLEEYLFEPSQALAEAVTARISLESVSRLDDVTDFKLAVAELGFTEEDVRRMSENESDFCELPLGIDCEFVVSKSTIQGRGVFASANFEPGDIIGPARLLRDGHFKRTSLGRFVNHARNPNARLVEGEHGILYAVAIEPIAGSKGGLLGDEITYDYRHSFAESQKYLQ